MKPKRLTITPPARLQAQLRVKKAAKGKSRDLALEIVELVRDGLIVECARDFCHQGEEVQLRVIGQESESAPPSFTLEMTAKVARQTLGAANENDILELRFLKWDQDQWETLRATREQAQSDVENALRILKP